MKFYLYFIVLIITAVGCVKSEDIPAPKHCLPTEACWPTVDEWEKLKVQVQGRLLSLTSFLDPCKEDAMSEACKIALKNAENPFFLEDHPEATQSTGWLNAWASAASQYAIAAEGVEDIIAGVNFARNHNLKLVIKGTGHDYLGRSNAPNSLLIWTHKMRKVTLQESFIPQGCSKTVGVPAVTVEAGARWLETYKEVMVNHGRYVQGGGCTSVGAAGGFPQGGGFGSYSKKFGTGAANMLEAEIVTADGKVLIANACQNQDLFWALRGGGGGTFGVVTKMTLKTHELPDSFGMFNGQITAKNDQAFKDLLEKFIHFYRENLNNEHWGEEVHIRRDNSLKLALRFQGLSEENVKNMWRPFKEWLATQPELFKIESKVTVVPGQKKWDYDFIEKNYPDTIRKDSRQDKSPYWWWAGDQDQVSAYWHAYLSRWLPVKLFQAAAAQRLAEILFKASRHWDVELHLNKGQANASSEAIALGKETSINPELYNAAMLLIIASGEQDVFPGLKGHEPNLEKGKAVLHHLQAAINIIREATPGAGTYSNEADYFEPDWQHAFWGSNYPRLLSIKKKYDPAQVFDCHHCVGSELVAKKK